MTQKEMLQLAQKAIEEDLSKHQLMYSDDVNVNEYDADEIWKYVLESDKIGSDGMKAKYPDWPR